MADFDAVVVGSGPNGLAAAIVLQQAGCSVLLLEGADEIGGGLRSGSLTLPGFTHDYCSAIHPLAALSPFFNSLPLAAYGLTYIEPPAALAHPFDDGTAAVLYPSLEQTAQGFGRDAGNWRRLMQPLVRDWPDIGAAILAPLRFPAHPFKMARFGSVALQSAARLAKRFKDEKTKGFWGGLAMHAQLPFDYAATSAIGLVLATAGHRRGWPFVQGGSQRLADALAGVFRAAGGVIETGHRVRSLAALPPARALMLDLGPRQLLELVGRSFSPLYRRQLQKFRLGMGVFKIDWALDGPIPFTAKEAGQAATVHVGGNFTEIAAAESLAWKGRHSQAPGLILAQQSLFDPGRAPAGKQTAWAYCHVPNGSTTDMTAAIENQVERFAPGFRDRILARHTMDTAALENHNANYTGGDIGGGANLIGQLFTRPVLRRTPYRTSARGIYLCSASTPPGGGVHGMCGYHAARRALRDIFR